MSKTKKGARSERFVNSESEGLTVTKGKDPAKERIKKSINILMGRTGV